jgi:hypothetical protein
MPRSYQVTPAIHGRQRATQRLPVRPQGRQQRYESARCQPGDLPAAPDGTARATPTTMTLRLRYRLLHVAGRLTRHARRLTLQLPADWPWAAAIAKAFKRLAALPA